ncbi:MAG: hypothetical protein N2745_11475 [Syntrophorhabdaceae bacterium]|nr:hypothetical protein [Syntrophorhabdaceae bacterium]
MHPSIKRNTLLSEAGVKSILSAPFERDIYENIYRILTKFQEIKGFASEIHTETHIVRPILKLFGYACESKPKFFEERIKGPDVALFSSEEARVYASKLWGLKEYYDMPLGILVLKRYGRSLDKGISGFYLEFENRIPVYQVLYMLKKTKTPWGILTNGKEWIIIKRPVKFELMMIEVDIEKGMVDKTYETFHLFYNIFSLGAISKTIPQIMDREREEIVGMVKEKRTSFKEAISGLKKKSEIMPKVMEILEEFSIGSPICTPRGYTNQGDETQDVLKRIDNINPYNIIHILNTLFTKKIGDDDEPGIADILFKGDARYSKEDILSLKILDLTPGFGTTLMDLQNELAYLSFVLPYREKNTFVAEWEDEQGLKKYIMDNVFYGVERSPAVLQILKNTFNNFIHLELPNFRGGNPLFGMTIRDISSLYDSKKQMGLFGKTPLEVLEYFKEGYKRFFALSDKIREDAEEKKEIASYLNLYRERIRDILDVLTATYLSRTIEKKKVQDLIMHLGEEESLWDAMRKKNWFVESKEMARKYGFFHFEVEFPFLFQTSFDIILIKPEMVYLWEEDPPILDITKSYIKSGFRFLKPEGKMVIYMDKPSEPFIEELKGSKKYTFEKIKGAILLSRKAPSA